ncbi:hypothetical protein GLP30_09420 [Photobacterium phosphoreum]|uniref:Uncharacterized protein n=1 Tax=Photobacterium phosphoreum TaxID=659 RepID=A0AAW4ZUY7_PHOPO|nr:hypothetical protein [Photobacterium phosphoreum]MCD9491083.1 hypothetical protein [Photobacterium phosphoreum]MCF2190307.1 hypothetical protein [Photobacterium phosphoreum]MCF2300894.1 hypothetical protein [Photobacterium phosphoreum]
MTEEEIMHHAEKLRAAAREMFNMSPDELVEVILIAAELQEDINAEIPF